MTNPTFVWQMQESQPLFTKKNIYLFSFMFDGNDKDNI